MHPHSENPVLQKLISFGSQLVEPARTVEDLERRRQAKLLASILLFFLLVTCGLFVVRLPVMGLQLNAENVSRLLIAFVTFPLLQLSRRGQVRLVSLISVVLGSLILFGLAATDDLARTSPILDYLVVVLLFGSLFLPVQINILVFVGQLTGILLVGRAILNASFPDIIAGPLSLHLTVGTIVILVGWHRNLLERSRLEQLAHSEQRLQDVIASNIDGMVVIDGAGVIQFLNPAAVELFDLPPSALIGQPFGLPLTHDQAAEITLDRARGSRTIEIRRASIRWNNAPAMLASMHDVTERKRMEDALRDLTVTLEQRVKERTAALRESEERFRGLYENSTVGIYRTTPDGRILLANPALAAMLGYSSFDELASRDLKQSGLAPAYPRAQFIETIEREGQIIGLESGWTRRDGTAIVVRESARAIRDPQGRTLYYDGTVEDITDRKRAEDRVRQLNRVYAVLSDVNQAIVRARGLPALFEATCRIAIEKGGFRLAWIGRLDEASQQVRVAAHAGTNDGYLEQLDTVVNEEQPRGQGPAAEALRTGQHVVVNDVEHDPRMAPWREAALSRGYRSSATFPLKVNGETRFTVNLYAGEPGFFDEDELRLLDELAMDLSFAMEFAAKETERRQAEETANGLAKFPAENPNPVLRIDQEGVLLYANEASVAMLADWQFVVGQPAPPVLRQMVSQALAARQATTTDLEHGQRIISFVATPVMGTDYVNLYGRDVTARARAEEAIYQLNAELEGRVAQRTAQLAAANKELEAFAYSVSHDLRAPLRAIDGFSRILLEDYADRLDAEGQRLFGIVRSSAQKMDQLITDLLALSRVTRSQLLATRLDMTALVHAVYAEITSSDTQAQFTLTVAALPEADGDATLLRQVWSNLLANAIKYTLPQPVRHIEVGGYRQGGECIYFVKDTGVGFNPAYAHKLFGVFQRLHKSEEFEGTGVGLAIVQRIIQRHGGRVWGEGDIDRGATFYFSLPGTEANDEQSY